MQNRHFKRGRETDISAVSKMTQLLVWFLNRFENTTYKGFLTILQRTYGLTIKQI